jgi:hypothetical protein
VETAVLQGRRRWKVASNENSIFLSQNLDNLKHFNFEGKNNIKIIDVIDFDEITTPSFYSSDFSNTIPTGSLITEGNIDKEQKIIKSITDYSILKKHDPFAEV